MSSPNADPPPSYGDQSGQASSEDIKQAPSG